MTLEEAIEASGQTQAQLCRLFGLKPSTVSGLKTGRISPILSEGPRSMTGPGFTGEAKAVCAALGVSPDEVWPEHVRRWTARAYWPERSEDPPEEAVALEGARRAVRDALTKLPRPNDARAIRLRYGLGPAGEHTLREAAEVMGRSCERVRQMEFRAIRYLRHPQNIDPIREHFSHQIEAKERRDRKAQEWRDAQEAERQARIQAIRDKAAERRAF